MPYNYLQSAVDGLVTDIDNAGGINPGSPLQVLVQKNEANQWWTTQDVPGMPGYFWIVSGEAALVVDIDNAGGVRSGSPLQVLEQKNEANQYWTTQDVPGMPGYFWIVSADQGLVIDIDNAGGINPGSRLQVLEQKNEANQYWTWAPAEVAPPPASGLGGSSQYVLSSATLTGLDVPLTSATAILDLVVEIAITESIVVSPTSGANAGAPQPLPIGFQINGVPPLLSGIPPATPGDSAIGWMQYGVKMWPGNNTLVSFAEYWPTGVQENPEILNTFDLSAPQPVLLPDNLTIPAGWTIRFVFNRQADGTITGFDCSVTDATGPVSPDMGINFLENQPLAAGGTISQADLAQLVSFQVVLVGFWAGAQATLVSGAGTITCTASTRLIATNYWPTGENGGTGENANSSYGVVAPWPNTTITQTFGVAPG